MLTIKRNQIVICALVVMIGVAGYLNYIDTTIDSTQMVLSDNLELTPLFTENTGEDILAIDDSSISLSNTTLSITQDTDKPGDAVFVNGSTDTSYFVQAKLDREQVRSKEKDILMEMVNSETTPDDKKSEAADQVLKLQQKMLEKKRKKCSNKGRGEKKMLG